MRLVDHVASPNTVFCWEIKKNLALNQIHKLLSLALTLRVNRAVVMSRVWQGVCIDLTTYHLHGNSEAALLANYLTL